MARLARRPSAANSARGLEKARKSQPRRATAPAAVTISHAGRVYGRYLIYRLNKMAALIMVLNAFVGIKGFVCRAFLPII
jgi:hypothetical protein